MQRNFPIIQKAYPVEYSVSRHHCKLRRPQIKVCPMLSV